MQQQVVGKEASPCWASSKSAATTAKPVSVQTQYVVICMGCEHLHLQTVVALFKESQHGVTTFTFHPTPHTAGVMELADGLLFMWLGNAKVT